MDTTAASIADHPWAFLISIVFLIFLEIPIVGILDAISRAYKVEAPSGAAPEVWEGILAAQGPFGAAWIGRIERVLFFLSLLFAPAIAVAWLAFKVASKWEAWTNLHKVPESLPGVTPLEFFRFRMALGSRTYQRFLVGTAANLISAFLAIGLFYLLPEIAARL